LKLPDRHVAQQFVLYALCGAAGVSSDFLVYISLLHLHVGYQAANMAGYFVGTLVSFVLNRRFTFKVMDRTASRMALFFGAAAIGYLASAFALWLLVSKFGINPVIAKLLTLGVVLVLQFSINRTFAFRTKTTRP
jgi:putative flippase GtrA